jgi:tetratricopeptide (TPR) repeat protein
MELWDVQIEQSILANARLNPLPEPATPPSPRWALVWGATLFRHREVERAERVWAGVPDDHELAPHARSWRALALARLGRLDDALDLLAEPGHLKGEILCALGRFDEGLPMIEAEREGAELVEWRALRLAHWLRRAGRSRDAAEMLDARLEKVARFGAELYTAALQSWLDAGEPERAVPHLEQLHAVLPGHALDLALDPRLEGVEGAKSIVDQARARDLDWLPEPIRALAGDPRLAEFSVAFLDRATSEKLHAQVHAGPGAPLGVLPGPAMWPALTDSARYVVIAQSLQRPARAALVDATVLWMVDPAEPDRIAFCLSPRIPAFLWPSAPADAESIRAALAPYARSLVVEDPSERDMPRRLRWFLGSAGVLQVPSPYTGELEEMGFHTFARVATTSPFLESYGWGSEHAEDPHVYFVDRGGLDGLMALRRTAGMDPERVVSESYRLRSSRAVLRLELHPVGFVADLRYLPSPHEGAVRAINERFNTRFPEDLPLDCVGVLMHFDDADDAASLRASLEEDLPSDELWRVFALAALLHDSAELEPWLDSLPPEREEAAHAIAWTYGRLGFLLKRALDQPDLLEKLQLGPHPSVLAPPEGDDDEDGEYEDEDEGGEEEDEDDEEDDE